MDAEHGEPLEEVATENLLHRALAGPPRGEVAVGRRDDAHLDRLLALGADRAHHAFLERPQEPDLDRLRGVADLVEEEDPPVRRLEDALARLGRSGEGASHVAEERGVDERGCHAGDVERDVRREHAASVARTTRRHGARDELLSRAGLAGDQDAEPVRRAERERLADVVREDGAPGRRAHVVHGLAAAHEAAHGLGHVAGPPRPGRDRLGAWAEVRDRLGESNEERFHGIRVLEVDRGVERDRERPLEEQAPDRLVAAGAAVDDHVEARDGVVGAPQAEALAKVGTLTPCILGVGGCPEAQGREPVEGAGRLGAELDGDRHAEKFSTPCGVL